LFILLAWRVWRRIKRGKWYWESEARTVPDTQDRDTPAP
jgi:hypothetical protein